MARAVTVRMCDGCKREVPYKATVRAVETIRGSKLVDRTQLCLTCWTCLAGKTFEVVGIRGAPPE